MELKYIIEICVAIDIAILGIAYPIIVDKISNIGEKYSSNYLSKIFNDEFPQKGFSKRRPTLSSLKLVLYSTIISFIFLIFSIPPLFETNIQSLDWILGNSAKLIVLTLSTLLTITFFYWLDLVFIVNVETTSFGGGHV
jgi:hypothetical protein